MKIKNLLCSLLVGSTLIVSLNFPKVVNARENYSEIPAKLEELKEKLDLTSTQERRIRTTFRAAFSQINDIFTPQQKQEMKEAIERGKTIRQIWSEANVSAEQRSQIKQIWQEQRETLRNIFTAEQQEILRQEIRTYFRDN
ncbi:MAG: hypothetical protein ACFBSE_12830 [Prochloraceae cyanobacterium]